MNSVTRKNLMGLASLLVLMFHFYIPFQNSGAELFLQRSAFVGVDLFFLASGYSLGKREELGYFSFIRNRLVMVYIPFVIYNLIQAIYSGWEIGRLVKSLVGIEFFTRGGGAFLWYVPGIMILYIISPLFHIIKRKLHLGGLPVMLLFWALIGVILQFGFGYTKAFILVNRMPAYFLGMYYDEIFAGWCSKRKPVRYVVDLALLISGILLVNRFCVTIRLMKPFAEMFYIAALPLVAALTEAVILASGRFKLRILSFLGKITLELYCLQMIFGYDIEIWLLKIIKVNMAAYVFTLLILTGMAFAVHLLMEKTIYKLLIRR